MGRGLAVVTRGVYGPKESKSPCSGVSVDLSTSWLLLSEDCLLITTCKGGEGDCLY